MPIVSVFNQQTALDFDVQTLQRVVTAALPHCLSQRGLHEATLPSLAEIDVSLVDDAAIAHLHDRFLNDPTSTDVITFHHGEIIVSVETAAREAAARTEPLLRELALYIIHGLLHLNGHTDTDDEGKGRMQVVQETILAAIWPLSRP